MANYTYNLWLGETDDRGAATPSEIVAAFNAFDWAGEVARANEHEEYSPTFTVEDADTGRQLWVSGYNEPSDIVFVSSYAYRVRKKVWFGLFERNGFEGPESRQDLSLKEAAYAIELFVNERHEELVSLVAV